MQGTIRLSILEFGHRTTSEKEREEKVGGEWAFQCHSFVVLNIAWKMKKKVNDRVVNSKHFTQAHNV